jgi:hypothetical protein
LGIGINLERGLWQAVLFSKLLRWKRLIHISGEPKPPISPPRLPPMIRPDDYSKRWPSDGDYSPSLLGGKKKASPNVRVTAPHFR